jgi:hypothetical protein
MRLRERAELGLGGDAQGTALCLSGGGVRSAAFCLGVVQGLARRELLRQFNYLSTVSGGGYIGAWLTRCIAGQHDPGARPTGLKDVAAVELHILSGDGATPPVELRHLREYTNYLTPQPGVASTDTWAGVVLWLRNTLVNWTVFLPLMLAVAAVPVFYAAVVCVLAEYGALADRDGFDGVVPLILAAAFGVPALMCLTVSVYHGCINLPSHQHPDTTDPLPDAKKFGLTSGEVRRKIVLWAMGWAFLAPLSLIPLSGWYGWEGDIRGDFWASLGAGEPLCVWYLAVLPACGVLACSAAYGLAWSRMLAPGMDDRHGKAFKANFFGWLGSCLLSAGILLTGAWLVTGHSVLWVAVAGPVWVVAAELLRSAAYVAVRTDGLRTDLDREWLARLSGDKLRIAFAYGLGAAAALVLPMLAFDAFGQTYAALAAVVGFLGGPTAALLGKASSSAFSFGVKENTRPIWASIDGLIAVAITLFIAALFLLLGELAAVIAVWPREHWGVSRAWAMPTLVGAAAILMLLCGGAALGLDRVVNLNRFSMHAVYRNRLVRAFLGTARPTAQRRPDRYANFDPRDNVRMWDTFRQRDWKVLFPVIGVTLNTTSGKDTARAERKGEPFIITPLHCGSASLGTVSNGKPAGAYIPTGCYAGADMETGPEDKVRGITLGTAITLSGAAVSPNMGYHSSPLVAFVMTLFNVRLGAWLPNPGWQTETGQPLIDQAKAARTGPTFAIPSLLSELAGLSDDRGEYVYLSDGGHFDNLGLYEMLRRRCRRIVVVDAGCDPDYGYFDLSHTLQRASLDLGVRVTFEPAIKAGRTKLPPQITHGHIVYPKDGRIEQQSGQLLYIKPWLPAGAPIELTAFKRIKPDFPHDTTANQFFTESDFESYRALGEYLIGTPMQQIDPGHPLALDAVFAALAARGG